MKKDKCGGKNMDAGREISPLSAEKGNCGVGDADCKNDNSKKMKKK